jgi:lipopolysaccharide export system permease protein
MRLFDRFLLTDLAVPFLIGVLTFVVILLGDVAREIGQTILNARTPGILVATYLWLRSPNAFVWSMPVGTLLAVSLAMARATRDGEITAMRAAGISFGRLCLPLIAAGLGATVVAFGLNEWVVPGANDGAMRVWERMMQTQPIMREEHNRFFRDQDQRRVFYVEHMNADLNYLENIVIWVFDRHGRLSSIVRARHADLQGRIWWLRDGVQANVDPVTGGAVGPAERFTQREVQLRAALQNYYAERRSAYEMSARELRDRVEALEAGGQDSHALAVELHFKYSIPFACVIFALIGAPLAFRYSRWGVFGGALIAILIVFLYNGVRSWTLAFGLAGILPPVVAGWLQNVLFGGIGLALIHRVDH